ncbi:hypothetical protein Fmac_015451 [Flemingia macrophylla]|uniref:Disease resistance protein RPS4B/Roq1-like leucine-rich repeats domain-containing protein n=1 Tax=Flemingia macrophylla TaxID=520843 RepID=A0ABD1MEL4_9FABA
MGKEIVRKESPKEPGKRSRLWFAKDIAQILEENKGTSQIEIILLDSPLSEDVEWDGEAFKKMKNLKTLIIRNGYFSKGPKHLPNSLRVLEWWRYSSQGLPDDFQPKNLAIFKLPNNGFTSRGLAALLSKKASYCDSLKSFPEILGKMENLTQLDLQGTPIRKFPLSFRNLTRLKKLVIGDTVSQRLSGCDASIFISNISMMPELVEITAWRWKGWPLPKTDEGAERVSSSMSSNVQYLHLLNCNLLDDFFPIVLQWFANVKVLNLSWNDFRVIPECIKECRFLTSLTLDDCESLREIKGIPPNLKYFSARNCPSLTSSSRNMLLSQDLHEAGNTLFYLPGANIPEWFECQTLEPPISIWFRNKFPTIAICLVMEPAGKHSKSKAGMFRPVVIINGHRHLFDRLWLGKDCTCLFDLQEIKLDDNLDYAVLENEWNHAEIIYEDFKSTPTPLNSGIHVLKHESNMEEIQFAHPRGKRKLDGDHNSSESENLQLLKKQGLVNMKVAETQFVQERQQHRMRFWSHMWNWARSGFRFFLLQ